MARSVGEGPCFTGPEYVALRPGAVLRTDSIATRSVLFSLFGPRLSLPGTFSAFPFGFMNIGLAGPGSRQ